jgi:hypothetical protein
MHTFVFPIMFQTDLASCSFLASPTTLFARALALGLLHDQSFLGVRSELASGAGVGDSPILGGKVGKGGVSSGRASGWGGLGGI